MLSRSRNVGTSDRMPRGFSSAASTRRTFSDKSSPDRLPECRITLPRNPAARAVNEFAPAHLRHVVVGHERVEERRPGGQPRERSRAFGQGLDAEAVARKQRREQLRDVRIIVHDQHARSGWLGRQRRTGADSGLEDEWVVHGVRWVMRILEHLTVKPMCRTAGLFVTGV